MKIKKNLVIEINKQDGFLRGFAVVDGIKQLIDIVPLEIESFEFFNFFDKHVTPALEKGGAGRVAFKKGKN